MSQWPSSKISRVLAALGKIGWQTKRISGTHRTLERSGYPDFVFAFYTSQEIGPKMLARIAKHTGLTPDDLQKNAHPASGTDTCVLRTLVPLIGALGLAVKPWQRGLKNDARLPPLSRLVEDHDLAAVAI